MQINTILDSIDIGSIALPTFQRGYVWNREPNQDGVAAKRSRRDVEGAREQESCGTGSSMHEHQPDCVFMLPSV